MSRSGPQVPSDRLRRLRERAGLTKRELAIAAGVSRNTIIRAEVAVPRYSTQVVIAQAMTRILGRVVETHELWPLDINGEAA